MALGLLIVQLKINLGLGIKLSQMTSVQVLGHESLSLSQMKMSTKWLVPVLNTGCNCRDRVIPKAHWPASSPKSTGLTFSERICIKN